LPEKGWGMKITGKKHFQTGEVVLNYPKVHWIFFVNPIVCLVIAMVLLIIQEISAGYIDSVCSAAFGATPYKIIIMILVILSAVYLLWRVIAFYFIEYTVTNKRLILKKGLFISVLVDMPIEKVESLIVVQSIWGNLFNYGTIVVSGVGGRAPRFSAIRKPYKVRNIIYDIIEKNKKITILREDLPKVAAVVKQVEEPVIQYGTFITSYPAGERKIESN
jgi:hypothetical protein